MIMEPADWYIEGCLKASEEDRWIFEQATKHLPKREEATPYHSGAHSLKHFRHALAIAGFLEDFRVLEIGFCLGHSAEIFYHLGASFVCSIENSERPQTLEALKIVKRRHQDFQWCRNFPPPGEFDFGFIDGDHSEDAINKDTDIMVSAGIEWVLYDDFFKKWGDTQDVFRKRGITPVAILGTMALCQFPA